MGTISGFADMATNPLDLCAAKPGRKVIRSFFGAKSAISLDGYLMPCKEQGYMMFSQSCATPMWIQIPVSRIRELEWLGHSTNSGLDVERVRLTL